VNIVRGDGLRLRRAEPDDVDFLVQLTTHADVEPYLAGSRPRDRASLLEEIERSQRESDEFGRFVVEVEEDGEWRRAGAMGFELANSRSRIANLGNLAIHPDYRGRHLSDAAAKLLQRYLLGELDFHRLQLEIYGFNERAMAHAERAGFVREGVRRRAYRRHEEWVDGVLYGLVREDLEP
jgi:RimJ/RimL family protein N-acetyltransferase